MFLLVSLRKFYSGFSNMSSHNQYLGTRIVRGELKLYSIFSAWEVQVLFQIQYMWSSSCIQDSVLGEFKLHSGFRA
jgi:hypothetical protein